MILLATVMGTRRKLHAPLGNVPWPRGRTEIYRHFCYSARAGWNFVTAALSKGKRHSNPSSMTRSPSAPDSLATHVAADHDLEALPAPRRPWRRATLAALSLSLVGSLALAYGVRGEAAFALKSSPPVDVGELGRFHPGAERANTWVRGDAELRADGAVHYSRPLERDSYRLAEVDGNDRLWVQIRVPDDPSDPDGAHFVPPTSFVGRLIPVSQAGIRHSIVRAAVSDAGQGRVADDAWLLIDGEAPHTTRWALGLVALFFGFATFSAIGLVRLTQRVT
jgi:hypothetical protein